MTGRGLRSAAPVPPCMRRAARARGPSGPYGRAARRAGAPYAAVALPAGLPPDLPERGAAAPDPEDVHLAHRAVASPRRAGDVRPLLQPVRHPAGDPGAAHARIGVGTLLAEQNGDRRGRLTRRACIGHSGSRLSVPLRSHPVPGSRDPNTGRGAACPADGRERKSATSGGPPGNVCATPARWAGPHGWCVTARRSPRRGRPGPGRPATGPPCARTSGRTPPRGPAPPTGPPRGRRARRVRPAYS